MSYDTKCGDLAEAFLSDHADETMSVEVRRRRTDELAQAIQDAIEDTMREWGL